MSCESIEEFETLLMHTKSSDTQNVIAGDCNVWMEMNEKSEKQRLSNTLQCFGMKEYVLLPTHKLGDTVTLAMAYEFPIIIENFSFKFKFE